MCCRPRTTRPTGRQSTSHRRQHQRLRVRDLACRPSHTWDHKRWGTTASPIWMTMPGSVLCLLLVGSTAFLQCIGIVEWWVRGLAFVHEAGRRSRRRRRMALVTGQPGVSRGQCVGLAGCERQPDHGGHPGCHVWVLPWRRLLVSSGQAKGCQVVLRRSRDERSRNAVPCSVVKTDTYGTVGRAAGGPRQGSRSNPPDMVGVGAHRGSAATVRWKASRVVVRRSPARLCLAFGWLHARRNRLG